MAELSKYQKQLSKEGVCVLTNIIPEDLLFLLSTYFQKREFEKRLILQDTASEFTLKEGPANDKLTAFFNQKKIHNLFSDITGEKIRYITQRLYYNTIETVPLGWHIDTREDHTKTDRIAALRLELSDSPYTGGQFEIEMAKDKKLLFPQLEYGQAIIFKIEKDFQHRVTQVESGIRKSLNLFICK